MKKDEIHMHGNACNMEYAIMISRISAIEHNNTYRYFLL